MLAKLGWWLLHNPDTLVARILKAKYYSDDNLLHAQTGNNPSYTWCSILQGMELLWIGCIWRVEDGTQIAVWPDPWIPNLPNFTVEISITQFSHIEKVSQLIVYGLRDRMKI